MDKTNKNYWLREWLSHQCLTTEQVEEGCVTPDGIIKLEDDCKGCRYDHRGLK